MSALSHKLNQEKEFPGLDIKVTIVGTGTGQVRLGGLTHPAKLRSRVPKSGGIVLN